MTLWDRVVLGLGKIHWKAREELSGEQKEHIKRLLTDDYYIILTRRRNHLSTFFVGIAAWVVTGKWSFWSHCLMNLEDDVGADVDFRLVEAVGKGTTYSPFEKVFDVQCVALIKPKNMTLADWTEVMDRARLQLGKPYDTLFDLKDEQKLSCVELVRLALKAMPDYEARFPNFEATIAKKRYLTPQMFADCPDFEVTYVVKV